MTKQARYIMVGGFLGAGKTTAVDKFAQYLSESGKRVGLICNDQSTGLVDTTILKSKGFPVEEITGGCFCCRFNSLLEATHALTRDTAPDFFLAEPVGSCTDLIATVSYPLRRIYGDQFSVAPLSVLVDPIRAARILGLTEGTNFSDKVTYVYRKQLEEADIIVVNKTDAHPNDFIQRIVSAVNINFPQAQTLVCSAKHGTGLDSWFKATLSGKEPVSQPLEINYDTYAEGEAELGWLNCTLRLESDKVFDGNRLLVELADTIRNHIRENGGEIAHLKTTLDPNDGTGTLSVVSLVTTEGDCDLRESLLDQVDGGELIVNLRAEADPNTLESIIRTSIGTLHPVRVTLEHLEQFRPARPVPTYRMEE